MTRFERLCLGVTLVLAAFIPMLFQDYWLRVCATALYFIILTSSWNLLLGYTGQLSFAHAAFAAIGAYTSGLLFKYTGLAPMIGVLLGGGVAAVLGYGLGTMCLRVRGPYLALMTLGFSEILRLVAQVEYKVTRGSLGLQVPFLFGEDQGSHTRGYYTLLVLTLLTLLVLYKLVHSKVGLYLQAIREDEDAAAVMGVDVVRWKVNAFVMSSLFAGLAGGIYAHLFVRVVAPQMLLLSEMGLILTMTIVGGLGTLTGPVLGAIVLVIVQEQVREISPQAHLLLFAILVILVMKFFRQGLYGLIATPLTRWGWLSTTTPLTADVTVDGHPQEA
jgi:branched-chain amino acid transport system permease protein